MATRAANISAIEKATEQPWDEWMTYLASIDAANRSHAEIAREVYERLAATHPNSGWWAQGITVAYEQEIGRREPGQSCDGDFAVGASKTLTASLDEALEAWVALAGERVEFSGVPVTREGQASSSEKWRYWRCGLDDGTLVAVNIYEKAPGKASVGVQHTKLESAVAVEHWRGYWKGLLKEL
ncbi:hypothetical protein ACEXOS_021240 [Herbiconiux sp. P16]|uniref:hypothetical protein n=1 Tax=Herbiconiux wuyangfengii TaxID=3342794 RepID=UPI0035B7DE2B